MELKHFWVQVWELTVASLKSRCRKTFAGFIWVVLNPLMMFGIQSLVFKTFMKIQVPDYHLFLLGGLLPWIFFSSTIQMGAPISVTQSHLLRSFKINPMVILASQVLSRHDGDAKTKAQVRAIFDTGTGVMLDLTGRENAFLLGRLFSRGQEFEKHSKRSS